MTYCCKKFCYHGDSSLQGHICCWKFVFNSIGYKNVSSESPNATTNWNMIAEVPRLYWYAGTTVQSTKLFSISDMLFCAKNILYYGIAAE